MKIVLPTTTKRQSTSHQTHTTKHHKCTLTLNPPSLQNKTADMVIQQHSRKFLMMDILMSETCWVHKTWNKIASDIKLVFYSSTSRKYSLFAIFGYLITLLQLSNFCSNSRKLNAKSYTGRHLEEKHSDLFQGDSPVFSPVAQKYHEE